MIHWLLTHTPALLLTIWGAVVFILAGNKLRSSWILGIVSEFAWAAYALWVVHPPQWGLLLGCVFYAAVYWRNWLRWGKD